MPSPLTVLVTGATGSQGGALARRLLFDGHRVRALTRSPQGPAAQALARLGAEVVAGSFADGEAIRRAARGTDAAFVVATPYEGGPVAEIEGASSVVAAVTAEGVPHVVYSSVASADERTGVPHFESKAALERELAGLGAQYTIVAPAYFMDNVVAPWTLPGLRQGTLSLALPADRPLQQVAVDDIAAFVAHVLRHPDHFAGRRVEIAADEVSGAEQAQILSDATGRDIRYVELPVEQLRSYGDQDNALMFEWLSSVGFGVDMAGLRAAYPEVGWSRFEEWARSRDWSLLHAPSAA